MSAIRLMVALLLMVTLAASTFAVSPAQTQPSAIVDAATLHNKILAGYQGWFRCPGDAADMGWIHWSGDSRRIMPQTLSFELWPDMSEYGKDERFAAPGFTHADRSQAYLFSWDNLQHKPPGSTLIPRRGGKFLWEQFHELARLKPDSINVAMFDEVDEGTAIFKVTSSPPTQAHFVGYEGLPSDWYLRLVGEGARMWRGQTPLTADIPIKP